MCNDFLHIESISLSFTEDVKSIQFMLYKGEIPHQELDEAKSGEDLFKLMLKYGLLSKSNTDFLIKLLEAKNLKPCVDKIFEFTQSNSEELEEPEEGMKYCQILLFFFMVLEIICMGYSSRLGLVLLYVRLRFIFGSTKVSDFTNRYK